jgi:hypothetical protein
MCDHGKSPEKVVEPSLAYTENLGHCLWDEWIDAGEDFVEAGYDNPFVLLYEKLWKN